MTAYTDIVEKVKEILDNGLDGVTVSIEPAEVGLSPYPEIGLYLRREDNDERVIGAGNPYMSVVSIEVFCSEYSPDGVREACRRRDALVGQVRDLVKTNRTLDGLCDITQVGDLEFDSARSEAGFFSAGILTLKVYVTS